MRSRRFSRRGDRDQTSTSSKSLSIATRGDAVEVVDAVFDSWVVRFEPLAELSESAAYNRAAAQGVVAGLVESLPLLREALRDRGAMRVVFSPEVRRALAEGSARLMGDGGLPVAVDQAGKVVEIAKRSGVPAAEAAAVAGLGLGAMAVAAWPVVLAVGVATAAAVAQQRWLERTFASLGSQLERIETRLLDDDLGVLDAADVLVDLVAKLGFERVPQQLREELAVTRRQAESIYFSRRRFVDRLKRAIEDQQTAHEAKTGERKAWAGDVAKQLTGESTAVDEMVVFLRAMVTRARLGAVTAGVLATDGAPIAALSLLDELRDTLRTDYWDLQNRLSALARSAPDSPIWRRLLDRSDPETARDHARALSNALATSIGNRLPDSDEVLALEVPAGWNAR
ncbi:MAG: hypothetical protein WD271_17745 [Acidimicrobiia bacterium]